MKPSKAFRTGVRQETIFFEEINNFVTQGFEQTNNFASKVIQMVLQIPKQGIIRRSKVGRIWRMKQFFPTELLRVRMVIIVMEDYSLSVD